MVEIRKLEKSFGSLKVLKGIDLSLHAGRIAFIVGPNAAGKTTLIKCILGLVVPDAGDILVQGVSVRGQWSYRKAIGYMPQVARFPENLTLRELLVLVEDLHGAPATEAPALLRMFDLEAAIDRPLRVLSGGTRQKVSAVLALMFDPQILILDEPTAGLDPLASSRQKDRILQERARGKAVVLTSHVMSELEELADRVIVLLEGQLYFDGTLHELRQRTGEEKPERAIARMMEENHC